MGFTYAFKFDINKIKGGVGFIVKHTNALIPSDVNYVHFVVLH